MLITLSRRTAICQSVAEVQLTGVAPLGAVSHRFNFNFFYLIYLKFLMENPLDIYCCSRIYLSAVRNDKPASFYFIVKINIISYMKYRKYKEVT